MYVSGGYVCVFCGATLVVQTSKDDSHRKNQKGALAGLALDTTIPLSRRHATGILCGGLLSDRLTQARGASGNCVPSQEGCMGGCAFGVTAKADGHGVTPGHEVQG